jgi:hypothetical protein
VGRDAVEKPPVVAYDEGASPEGGQAAALVRSSLDCKVSLQKRLR